ncbi:GH25 family lysozyme [Lysinibacillus irui]|uniref:GH25 family lysozyme n=1 Tax=Lysinibacillus irui TaxID=2998077 RepID=A0ABU5NQN3_9BACI|nr:GH25 family lysozyme [Lysinibacillus irui]MEA0556089.1 GH25 family lysozyme [Lysinibacillus irui]MEA0978343.1 GH25 family lysozyme [Lysinibacillus irui]MEA1044497.1 GH25 family lysozyme [Lysinibacillus irui]
MSKIIDISHHQGAIDWSKASKDVSLAIIRTQYGTSTIDRKYIQNIEGCKKYEVPFGVYIYVTFKNVAQAVEQAKDFYNRARSHDPLFYVVDVEESFGASVLNIVQGTQAFVDYLKSKGVKVGLYTGHHFYKPYRMDTVKNYDFLWIPRYSGANSVGKKPDFACDLWQYTDRGIVHGIKGPVDLNLINGSKPLSWFTEKDAEGLTLKQYEELKAENKQLKQDIAEIKELLGGKAELMSNATVAATHKDAWDWAIREGIIKGDGKSMNPTGALTRQQMATLLKRYYDKFIK